MSVGVASATTRGSLVDLLADAGLTGRGGAAFSTAVKLEAAQRHRADLIVNACDGEPGTVKDAWVVARHLPALLEGARLAAGRRPAAPGSPPTAAAPPPGGCAPRASTSSRCPRTTCRRRRPR